MLNAHLHIGSDPAKDRLRHSECKEVDPCRDGVDGAEPAIIDDAGLPQESAL